MAHRPNSTLNRDAAHRPTLLRIERAAPPLWGSIYTLCLGKGATEQQRAPAASANTLGRARAQPTRAGRER